MSDSDANDISAQTADEVVAATSVERPTAPSVVDAGADEDKDPWQRRPSTYLMLSFASLLCVFFLYETRSLVERTSFDLDVASKTLAHHCSRVENHTLYSQAMSSISNDEDVASVSTRPPPLGHHVLIVICDGDQKRTDEAGSDIMDTVALMRGRLLRLARESAFKASAFGEVPSISTTMVQRRPSECALDEAFSVNSIGSVNRNYWTLFLKNDNSMHRGDLPVSECEVDHNQKIVCTLPLEERARQPLPLVAAADSARPNNGSTNIVKRTVASVLASIVGVTSLTHAASKDVELLLIKRHWAACKYATHALHALKLILEECPTMPLLREVGDSLNKAVLDMSQTSRVVRGANDLFIAVSHPSLVPQVFFPLEQVLAIHMSFLLPLIVAFLAGLGATMKELRSRRRNLK